jgi:hypothetical protein
MSNPEIARHVRSLTATFAVSSTLSPAFDVRAFAGGGLMIPTPWGGGTCTFKASATPTGTYRPIYDKDGTLVDVNPAANTIVELHEAVMAQHYVKVVKALAVTGARTVRMDLKG